jgi:hypothetical protein
MIYQQLEQIHGDPGAIQPIHQPIAILFLWATQFEILNEPWEYNEQPYTTQHRFLELWDRIHTHITNPVLAEIYLEVLLRYTEVNHNQVVEGPGSKQVARVASLCLLHVLSAMDPTSTAVEDIHQHYTMFIPHQANFEGLLCYHTINAIHALFLHSQERRSFEWMGYKPHPQEHILFADILVQVVHHTRGNQKGVPCWILRFVLHSLSMDPPPPTSVIVSCLSIIATDLGCDIPSARTITLDERYVHL